MKRLLIIALLLVFSTTAFAADAKGKWKASWETPVGTQVETYVFDIKGQELTGTITTDTGTVKIEGGKVDGDSITFFQMADIMGNSVRLSYTGKVSDDKIQITRTVGDFGSFDSVATRDK